MSESAEDTAGRLFTDLDTPMAIVTAAHAGRRSGCLVGFDTQCSFHPPRFLVCVSKNNHTYPLAEIQAEHEGLLGVHLLSTPQHRPLARLFGEQTEDEIDKFAAVSWHSGPEDVPVLDDCPTWFAGRVAGRLDGGDHVVYLLAPVAASRGHRVHQLGMQQLTHLKPGHPA